MQRIRPTTVTNGNTGAVINTATVAKAAKPNRRLLIIRNTHATAIPFTITFGSQVPVAGTTGYTMLPADGPLIFNSESMPTEAINIISGTASVLFTIIEG